MAINTNVRADVSTAKGSIEDYSAGLQAYLKNDYVLAQQKWLRAAKSDDSKAMFNLGLLHQEKLIQNATIEKAETWFMLAGKHGYSASYNHYGNYLLKQSRKDEGIEVLKKAAAQGFYPAQKKLEILGILKKSAVKTPVQVKKTSSPKIKPTSLSEHRKWIIKQPVTNWTIQLIAFPEQEKIERFIGEQKPTGDWAYFMEKTNTGVLYKLIYGSYSSKAAAEKGRDSLPPELSGQGPWLRSMKSVKDALKSS